MKFMRRLPLSAATAYAHGGADKAASGTVTQDRQAAGEHGTHLVRETSRVG
jgi:hypothetical protein